MKPNIPLLITAYEILDGIPERNFNLTKVFVKSGVGLCDSIGCGIGWLAMHPHFNELGLCCDGENILNLKGRSVTYLTAAEEIFGISIKSAEYLFEPEYSPKHSQKAILLRRIRKFIKKRMWTSQ